MEETPVFEKKRATPAERAAKLRQDLRDGRQQRASQAISDHVQNAGDHTAGDGGQLQIISGEGGGTGNSNGRNNSPGRGAEEESIRIRSAARRSRESDRRANDPLSSTATANQRTVGALIAEEPIPTRLPEPDITLPEEPKRGRGRPRKEPDTVQEPPKETLFTRAKAQVKEGKPLSKKEVEELHEPFIAALKDDFKYLDEGLWWYSNDASEPQIWSDMDDEEVETIARVLLRRAERSVAAATFVRNVVDAADYIDVAMITVPRTIKTMQQLNKRPKPPQKDKTKA